MYKTSPEQIKRIQRSLGFLIRVPLAVAYMILSKMDMPSRPTSRDQSVLQQYRQARKQVARERLNITPKKLADAYNHWNTNKELYGEIYQSDETEPNSWTQYYDEFTIKDMIKMNFESFNSNYVESQKTGDFEREKQQLQDRFGLGLIQQHLS